MRGSVSTAPLAMRRSRSDWAGAGAVGLGLGEIYAVAASAVDEGEWAFV